MYWSLDESPPSFWLARPSAPEELDVVVVGAGFVGLSTAWWLAKLGRRPVVLEAGAVAGKASGRNAGFLLTGSAEPLAKLARHAGKDRALAFWQRSRENRELLRRELLDPPAGAARIDADFLPEGSWIASLRGTGQHEALEESVEILRAEGFELEWRDAAAVREASGSEGLEGAIFQGRDGGLDPARLCRGLARTGGFEVRTGVRVQGFEEAADGRVHLFTDAGEILARRAVLAVNAYAPSLLPELSVEVRPVRGQALATEPGGRVLEGVWYVNDGYDYIRQLTDGTVILGGRRQVAEAQEVGYLESPTATVQGALEDLLAGTFPQLGERSVRHRWAGTMGFTSDGFPVVGRVEHAPAVLYAVGFSGHGMSLGFATGRHLARRVQAEAGDGGAATEPEPLFP